MRSGILAVVALTAVLTCGAMMGIVEAGKTATYYACITYTA